jgi:prepilin-type N-terminal cleavage/methylation domain-containing protein
MIPRTRNTRAGFTLVELIVATGILAAAFWMVGRSFSSGRQAFRTTASIMEIDAEGNRTMRRIVEALRASEAGSISSIPTAPFHSTSADFQILEQYDGSQTPLSAPRSISIDAPGMSVMWTENPGLANERRTRWSNDVAPLLEGETLNGVDDNGNGLIDEAGLCFSREGNLVTIGITIRAAGPSGPLTRTWMAQVACRN